MSDSLEITPEIAKILLEWVGLKAEVGRSAELAKVFQIFRERVQRLYDIDVEKLEFDFLRPLE